MVTDAVLTVGPARARAEMLRRAAAAGVSVGSPLLFVCALGALRTWEVRGPGLRPVTLQEVVDGDPEGEARRWLLSMDLFVRCVEAARRGGYS